MFMQICMLNDDVQNSTGILYTRWCSVLNNEPYIIKHITYGIPFPGLVFY